MKLNLSELEAIIGHNASTACRELIDDSKFLYEPLTQQETETNLKDIIDVLFSQTAAVAGEKRLSDWEVGWQENFNSFRETAENPASLRPKYFNKYPVMRLRQSLIKPLSDNLEQDLLHAIVLLVVEKNLGDADHVYEFGCGTGHNILKLVELFKNLKFFGLDWSDSSNNIIDEIARVYDVPIRSKKFDYFNPDYSFKLSSKSLVYTVASLEQVGARFQKFYEYLLETKPKTVIHIEPFPELLDETNLYDSLSRRYFKKRGYLDGYFLHLQEQERLGKINIIDARRTFVGSKFTDGYSVVVWSPVQ